MKILKSTIIPAFLCTLLLMQHCDSLKNSKKQAKSSWRTNSDYIILQKEALAFIPSIGKQGGELNISLYTDPQSFNPITSTETTTSEITKYIFEGLVKTNGVTLLIEPNLAASWDVSEDMLVWTFHLRPGVFWSDSTPFCADDVLFTFNNLIYNKSISPNAPYDIFTIDGKRIKVAIIDSMTVTFTLPSPYAPFLQIMNQEILPKHVYARLVNKGTFTTELNIKTLPEHIVGTGPFILDSYLSSQKVVLKRNTNYWKKDSDGNRLPYLDSIIFHIITDPNNSLQQFTEGYIDYLQVKIKDYAALKKKEESGDYTIYRLGPSGKSNILFFNQNRDMAPNGKRYQDSIKAAWFGNVNFRRAVSYAIDRQAIIDTAMNGLGYPQWSPMKPSEGYFFSDKVTKYPYDIEKAKTLLKQEGFIDRDDDGIIEDAKGTVVELSFISNSGNTVRNKVAKIVGKNLEQLGFRINFQLLDFKSIIQKISNPPYAWDAIMIGVSGGIEPYFSRNIWLSSGALHMWYPEQKQPATEWERIIDSLFDAGVKEMNIQKRKEIYDRWQLIVSEQLPLIYTVVEESILCMNNRVENVNPSITGGLLHNVEYLYIINE